jgi:putative intracellular protease/amidase
MAETNNAGPHPAQVVPAILMPLPDCDFDPTQSAVPWAWCASRGWKVAFSTEHGDCPQADPYKLKGPLPGLLSAAAKAQVAYRQMSQDPAYQHPLPYAEIDPQRYQALLLPGGDGLRMRQYLESQVLRGKVLQFWQQAKLIAAICRGVLVLARTIDPRTGRSLLYGRRVTTLPKSLDRLGYLLDSRLLKRGRLEYSNPVADEVHACLAHPQDFSAGRSILAPYAVIDGNLVTSRWSMDAELFSRRFTVELARRLAAGVAS